MKQKADLGVIGLGVMGENLILNFSDHGWSAAVYNRTAAKVDRFLAQHPERSNLLGADSIEDLTGKVRQPRKILLMVKAGKPVDLAIEALLPFLEPGDMIMDGGNSHFQDTIRRQEALESRGLLYVGAGISGGEEGARFGPSIMPGGSAEAWPEVKEMLRDVAARIPDGFPCCDWIGPGGAGHFVKMVHNGIEYGDMQLIAETFHLLRDVIDLDHREMQAVFSAWNRGVLDSYLVEITADILGVLDGDSQPLLEKVLDAAGQKGTGRWTAAQALELGVPLTLIIEAVQARSLSALKEQRRDASAFFPGPGSAVSLPEEDWPHLLGGALYAAKIISYTQGFMLMQEASREYGWDLNYGRIALIWREGCIIRSAFLEKIHQAYQREPDLSNLLEDPFFQNAVAVGVGQLRRVVKLAVDAGIPVPSLSAALAFFDGYRTERLPANLIQAQRDYFGAHTYERVDRPRGEFFHSDWKPNLRG